MTKQEKAVIYFLIFMLVLGLGLKFYKSKMSRPILKVESADFPISEKDIQNVLSKQKVGINTASAKDFQRLPGIGPHLAERIVQHRAQNGNFAATDDLKNVKGIGAKKYEGMKDYLTVE